MFKKMEQFFEDLQNSNNDNQNEEEDNKVEINLNKCPNCGANLKGNSCEYCGSILKTENEITDKLFDFDGFKDDFKKAAKTARELFKEIF